VSQLPTEQSVTEGAASARGTGNPHTSELAIIGRYGVDRMTVISTVITRYCTAHASDSLITELQSDGSAVPAEWERSKIVPVRHWRGAVTYWGLAKYGVCKWSTFDFLQEQARTAANYGSAEEFAQGLSERLQAAINQMSFVKPVQGGIGIHFTAYEYIDGYWIPELFLISNWADTSYRSLRSGGVGLSSETCHTIAQVAAKQEHKEVRFRRQVHEHLHQRDGMFIYNNGNPVMFNSAANAMLGMFRALAKRGKLASAGKVHTYLAMARRPIEVVSKAYLDFCREGARVVGGKPHDLAITPNGEYLSTTGDV
jgi:hypothetical protein